MNLGKPLSGGFPFFIPRELRPGKTMPVTGGDIVHRDTF